MVGRMVTRKCHPTPNSIDTFNGVICIYRESATHQLLFEWSNTMSLCRGSMGIALSARRHVERRGIGPAKLREGKDPVLRIRSYISCRVL